MSEPEPKPVVDFTNTEIAFSHKTNSELKKMGRLFRLMNNPALVNLGSSLGLLALKMRLPFAKSIIKSTIFEQFCGGEQLLDCQNTLDRLSKNNVLSILDYGAESKTTEDELNHVMTELTRAVEFAASNNSVPVVSLKVTGLCPNELLENMNTGKELSSGDQRELEQLNHRLDTICSRACDLGVGVFIDAEESWMQDAIDSLVEGLMEKYNQDKGIVYNTFQMYRHDKLEYLKKSHQHALENGYILGAKIVRGAYMEKERERANEENYPSPIQPDKEATDRDFNAAIRYCVDHYESIASCNATHNLDSCLLQAQLIHEKEIYKNHPNLNFCQLFGMSDQITFNLAEAGYNVAKYIPYGPVNEVVPYLIRRAQENTSVTGEMSRELQLIQDELRRRALV